MVADLLKISILGTMPGGEVWSVNPVFKMFSTRAMTDAEMLALVTAVNGVNFPSGLHSKFSAGTTVTGCRVEARRLTGELDKVAEGSRVAPVVGTGTGALPYQSAAVVTLLSLATGASGRGRIYWPVTGATLSTSTLRLTSSDALAIAQSTDTFLTAMQVALESALSGTDLQLCVWSRKIGAGFVIYKLRVGDVVDTQRRRRDALKETLQLVNYQGAA